MAAVVEDKPVAPHAEFTKDLVALFEANLRNSEECLGPYLDHAARTWRMSVEWASNRIPRREGNPNFDGERDRRIFELTKEIFVKLMPSFPKVEAQTWKDLKHWDPRNTTKTSAGDLGQKSAVRDRGEKVELSPTEKKRWVGGGAVNG
jgi:hypothetical protein